MSKTIILIAGLKRSGKDYTASLIEEKLESVDKYWFAKPIKDIVCNTFNIDEELLDTFKNNPTKYNIELPSNLNNINFRELLQNLGTEGIRNTLGNKVWVKYVHKQIKKSKSKYFIIPDLRFDIEYKYFLKKKNKYNVLYIKVKNKKIKNKDTHSSEKLLDDSKFDYIIDNTNHDIEEQINKIISNITNY